MRNAHIFARSDRKRGGAVSGHRDAADLLQHRRVRRTSARKTPSSWHVRPRVIPAVARQFVALGDDAANQSGKPLRHPAQREERRCHLRLSQTDPGSYWCCDRPAWKTVPIGAGDTVRERLRLKTVLYVHRHGIALGRHDLPGRLPAGASSARRRLARRRRSALPRLDPVRIILLPLGPTHRT